MSEDLGGVKIKGNDLKIEYLLILPSKNMKNVKFDNFIRTRTRIP